MPEEKTGTKLLGVDVGFSAKRPTTGIAVLDGDKVHLAQAGTSWESRVSKIPSGFRPSVIAIDGPLLPQGADNLIRRRCEAIFVRAPFRLALRADRDDRKAGIDPGNSLGSAARSVAPRADRKEP